MAWHGTKNRERETKIATQTTRSINTAQRIEKTIANTQTAEFLWELWWIERDRKFYQTCNYSFMEKSFGRGGFVRHVTRMNNNFQKRDI